MQHPLTIRISSLIKEQCPLLQLGCLSIFVKVQPTSSTLQEKINETLQEKEEALNNAAITEIPTIKSSRQAYRNLGKEPSRYRLSAEALLRRVVKGKGIYQINNAVDTLNWISMRSGYSIGGYDANKIEGTITLGKGEAGEPYEAIGRGAFNIENLPVLRDEQGAFGSPTSDSVRTMVTSDMEHFLLIFFNFGGHHNLSEYMEYTASFLQLYAKGSKVSQWIVS